ncbi:hypothetical protein CR66_03550 [Campylobacter mucosalis]|uniref:AAC(3) family N-acetyltransferase n=1 Tax=Campylobacter mucosalis TaxID=202 RepID=UPI0004D6F6FD|nr:AAC(3) family N-acetyltransferase [Campylobacter mucosalis]KEA46272.1 hypothetical protein CR66_03550 [Campylobacter mucosalis]QKF62740.1 aminoglycoside N3'-acetyltransferase [Campylobacter mucosalis]
MLSFEGKIYTKDELITTLKSLGIKNGDTLLIHAELFRLGKITNKSRFLGDLVDCFLSVVGKNGTIVMPTFTYSFCRNEVYDKLNSKSTVGVLSEYFRHLGGVVRTDDPIFSFAIYGKDKDEYLKPTTSCFGEGCVYEILHKKGAKFLCFGDASKGWTFYLYAEQKIGVSYRYFKEFSGDFIDENGVKSHKSIKYFVRKLEAKSILDKQKQIKMLKDSGNFNYAKFGGGDMVLIDLARYYDTFKSVIKADENTLLKE